MSPEIEAEVEVEDRDARMVDLLARGFSQRRVARECGVCDRTVRRRLEKPEFRSRVTKARQEIVDQSAAMLGASLADAIKTLRELMRGNVEVIRLGAARAVLATLLPLRLQDGIIAQLNELEARRTP